MTSLVLAVLCAAPAEWKPLAEGIEYRTFALTGKPETGRGRDAGASQSDPDGLLHVVRVDPAKVTLDLGLRSEAGGEARTAAAWADAKGYVVTMNAGMFDIADGSSNVGHLRHGAHLNNPKWNAYQSVLVFGPAQKGPAAALLDRDADGFDATQKKYASAVQDLRLIKREGASVWKPNGRKWSEAMIATDKQGRLLFLFSRTPYEMAELNAKVLALPLEIVRAMHAEGGPEASLSIRSEVLTLDLNGSYETGFNENDGVAKQWPIPNVIGVLKAK